MQVLSSNNLHGVANLVVRKIFGMIDRLKRNICESNNHFILTLSNSTKMHCFRFLCILIWPRYEPVSCSTLSLVDISWHLTIMTRLFAKSTFLANGISFGMNASVMLDNVGLRTEPCGTPLLRNYNLLVASPKFDLKLSTLRNFLLKINIRP